MDFDGLFFLRSVFSVHEVLADFSVFKNVLLFDVIHRRAHEVSSRVSRVLRGGSWNNNPKNLRVANRNRNTPTNTNNNNGFRCAKTLSEVLSHFRVARVDVPPM